MLEEWILTTKAEVLSNGADWKEAALPFLSQFFHVFRPSRIYLL